MKLIPFFTSCFLVSTFCFSSATTNGSTFPTETNLINWLIPSFALCFVFFCLVPRSVCVEINPKIGSLKNWLKNFDTCELCFFCCFLFISDKTKLKAINLLQKIVLNMISVLFQKKTGAPTHRSLSFSLFLSLYHFLKQTSTMPLTLSREQERISFPRESCPGHSLAQFNPNANNVIRYCFSLFLSIASFNDLLVFVTWSSFLRVIVKLWQFLRFLLPSLALLCFRLIFFFFLI